MFRRGPEFRTEQGAKLENELERQADIYRVLGVQKDVIMRLVAPRPDRLPKYLNIPVVTLGTSVDLNRQAGLAGIRLYYDLSHGYDTAGGITFDGPHLIWMQDGSKYKDKSVEWVRGHLQKQKNERPDTQYDVVALALVHPDIRKVLRDHSIDAPGTALESGRVPDLLVWFGDLRLRAGFVDDAAPSWGSASCGS